MGGVCGEPTQPVADQLEIAGRMPGDRFPGCLKIGPGMSFKEMFLEGIQKHRSLPADSKSVGLAHLLHKILGGFHSCGDQSPLHADMLKIETLGSYEVSPWMDLETAMANLPPSKHLHIAVHPNDVVVDSPDEVAAKIREILA